MSDYETGGTPDQPYEQPPDSQPGSTTTTDYPESGPYTQPPSIIGGEPAESHAETTLTRGNYADNAGQLAVAAGVDVVARATGNGESGDDMPATRGQANLAKEPPEPAGASSGGDTPVKPPRDGKTGFEEGDPDSDGNNDHGLQPEEVPRPDRIRGVHEERLEPGGVMHLNLDTDDDNGESGWQDGPDDTYFDPAQPERADVGPNSIAVAKGTENDGPILGASTEGGQVVTFHNSNAKLGAVINVGAEEVVATGAALADELLGEFPSLVDPTTQVHHFGVEDTLSPQGVTSAGSGLRDYLETVYGIRDVTIAHEVADGEITLDPVTGYVEAANQAGDVVYRYP